MKRSGLLALIIIISAIILANVHSNQSGLCIIVVDSDEGLVENQLENTFELSDTPSSILRELGNWTLGAAESVWIEGDIAFSGMGAHLVLFDVTNKSQPDLISSFWFSDFVEDVCVSEGIAFVASGDAGLVILNVTDPQNINRIGSHFEDEYAKTLFVQNDFLYLATFSIFRLINISDASNPQVLSTYSGGFSGVTNVHADGDVLGICIQDQGVRFLNTSNPSSLTYIGNYDPIGHVVDVHIEGRIVYCLGDALTSIGIAVLNLTYSSPWVVLVATESLDTWTDNMDFENGYGFVGNRNLGLTIINFTDPTDPEIVYKWDTKEWMVDTKIMGNFCYIADHYYGLRIIDVSNFTDPFIEGEYRSISTPRGFVMRDNLVYLVDKGRGLTIFDVSNPREPNEVGYCTIPYVYGGVDVRVNGTIACILSESGLWTVNVSDDSNPVALDKYTLPHGCFAIEMIENFCFVGCGGDFSVFNVTDPTDITLVDTWSISDQIYDVLLYNDVAFLGTGDGYTSVNISDIEDLSQLWEYDIPMYHSLHSLFVVDNLLYGSVIDVQYFEDNGYLLVHNISSPHSPSYVTSITLPSGVNHAFYYDEVLFLELEDLQLYNLTNLGIEYFESYPAENDVNDWSDYVYARDDIVYLVDKRGFWILDHDLDSDSLYTLDEVSLGTDCRNSDSDFDLMPDNWENSTGLNPLIYNPFDDPDVDDLFNIHEYGNGTLPLVYDTDFDTIPDGWEVVNGLNPLLDDANLDPDDDDVINLHEFGNNTHPFNSDTDFDLMPDGWEIANSLNATLDDAFLDPDIDLLENLYEFLNGTLPRNNDTDFDLVPDGWEVFHGLNATFDDAFEDPDVDAIFNLYEYGNQTNPFSNDSDSDLLSDFEEIVIHGTNPISNDTDFDLMPDYWEVSNELDPLADDALDDFDNDNLLNYYEYTNGTLANSNDTDSDLMPDYWEITRGTNATLNDAYEDYDSDLLLNLYEYTNGTMPLVADTDFDLMDDYWEVLNDLNPLLDDAGLDPDNDNLVNIDEYTNHTLPRNNDTDSDLMPDGWEVQYELDPLFDDSAEDPDGDTFTNLEEYVQGTNPKWYDPLPTTTTTTTTTTTVTTTTGTTTTQTSTTTTGGGSGTASQIPVILISIIVGVGITISIIIIFILKRR